MTLINWDLIKNPYNWVVIYLMVAIGALIFAMIDPLKTTATQGSPP